MISVTRHGPEIVGELRPFWLALVAHHAEVAPRMGRVRGDDESWALRRAQYAGFLAEPGAFALIARSDGEPVGYAIVTLDPGSPTFADPDRIAFIGSLAVLPAARGQGAGRALIDRAQAEADAAGVRELRLDVLEGNARALAFYADLGFEPYLVGLRRPPKR